MPQNSFNLEGLSLKVSRLIRKTLTTLKAFWKGFLLALVKYIRSKTKNLPAILPKGRREMINAVLERSHHQEFLQKFGAESGISLEHIETTFRKYLHEIAADLNYLIMPFWDMLLTWVFETVYEGLEVDVASLAKLREVAGKKPIVFVSSHRSHMDYLLLSYIFYRHNIPMPHICSGDNLSFWPLGPIFRKSGAFFIRRSYDGNRLYAAALQAYIEEILREKTSMEFFIEGTRSRTGKLIPPRLGILSIVLQSYWNKTVEDVLLVPTSVTYESVLEDKSYFAEQAGASKKEEGLWDLFRLRRYLRKRKGKVYIQFSEALSLANLVGASTPASPPEKRERVRQVASELTYGINKSSVVTPASLVAMAILTHSGRSITGQEIQEKVDRYLDYLQFKEAPLSGALGRFAKSAVQKTLDDHVHNHLLKEYSDGGQDLYVIDEDRRPLLDYNKNTSLHFFVSLSVLATILKSVGSRETPLSKVEEDYVFLQDLFQYEFTFSRRQSLRSHLERLLSYLTQREVLRFEGDQILFVHEEKNLEFFSSPILNFLEGYYTLWRSLPSLGQEKWEQKELLRFLRERGQVLYLKEEISRQESTSKFTLLNALAAFRDLGILKEEKEGWGKRKRTFYTLQEGQGGRSALAEKVGGKLSELLGRRPSDHQPIPGIHLLRVGR